MKKNPARNSHFDKEISILLEQINSSIEVDKRLFNEDIEGSIAHCSMLVKTKIISPKNSIKNKKSIGGTAPENVKQAIKEARKKYL